MPRYTTSGIPQQLATGESLGLSAFMPHYNRLAASGATVYKYETVGFPGTLKIPLEARKNSVPSPDLGDIALMGLSRSTDNYDAFWPNLYITGPDPIWDTTGGTAKVQVYNPVQPELTTMIPVPATDLRALYQRRSAMLSGGVAAQQGPGRSKALNQATNFARWAQRKVGNGPLGSGVSRSG